MLRFVGSLFNFNSSIMYRKILLVIIVIAIPLIINAQVRTEQPNQAPAALIIETSPVEGATSANAIVPAVTAVTPSANDVIDQYKNLKQKLDALKKGLEEVEKQTIGYLKVNPENVEVFDLNTNTIKVSVKKIHISIRDGYINNIEVYCQEVANGPITKYTNSTAPIGITHRRFTKNIDKLYLAEQGSNKHLIFQRVINVDSLEQYIPDDIDINFDRGKNVTLFPLKRGVGINSIFDIRLYSDALALFGDEENGIAQTDIRYKNIIHRSNIPNTGFIPFQYFKFNFSASKFDSKDKYIEVANYNNTDLLKKASVTADISLNIANQWLGFKSLSRGYIDIGGGIGGAKFKTATDTLSITTSNVFLELGFNLKSSSNIGMDISGRLIKLFSPSTKEYSETINQQYFNFMKFSVDFYWNPLENSASRFFARVNYITSTNNLDKKDQFFQVQVGYSLLLSDLIKK